MTDRGKCARILWTTLETLGMMDEILDGAKEVRFVIGELANQVRKCKQKGCYSDAIDMALNLNGDKSIEDTMTRTAEMADKIANDAMQEIWAEADENPQGDAEEVKDFLFNIIDDHFFYYLHKTSDGWLKKSEELDTEEVTTLPAELDVNGAKEIFSKAVKAGLMQPLSNGRGYLWDRSNALLAYICGKIYCGDKVEYSPRTKSWTYRPGWTFFPESALRSLFVNRKGTIWWLGKSRCQLKGQSPPKGWEDIDNLFDEAT